MRFDSEFWEFVNRHAGDDVTRLRLKYYRDPRPWMPAAIAHIEALPKARQKFGRQAASAGGGPMLLPSVLAFEQATPPAVAAYNASFVPRAARVVDMTAGLGSDSFHIASRAAQLHCFDLDESNARALEINFAGRQNVTVH